MSFWDKLKDLHDSVGKPIYSLVGGFALSVIMSASGVGLPWSLLPIVAGMIAFGYFVRADKK